MFCVVPMPLHSPLMNLEVNFGSLSLMNFSGSPNCRNMCWIINPAVSLAVILSLHGMNIAAFVQSWSVTVSIKLYPCEISNLVMKSSVTVSNGIASCMGKMGDSGALVVLRPETVLFIFLYFTPCLTFSLRLMVTHRLDSCDHLRYRLVTRYVLVSLLLS